MSDQDRIVHLHLLHVGLERGNRVVDRETQHLKALRSVFGEELDEPGNLELAWTAPRGPEVEQDHLALVRTQRNVTTLQVLEREVEVRGLGVRGACA